MERDPKPNDPVFCGDEQIIEPVEFDFGLKRRTFVQLVTTGLMVAAAPLASLAQDRGGGGRRSGGGENRPISTRIHIGKDGRVTVLTGKVEIGQGARAEFTQAAAEELRLPVEQIQVVLADTDLVPNDGLTAGSRSTPGTVPVIRQAAAAAREALLSLAAQRWKVEPGSIELREGRLNHTGTQRTLTFGELAQSEELPQALQQAAPAETKLTEVGNWKVMGTSVARPNARDLVTGAHRYSSDLKRPGMLRGKILRPPSYGAKLLSVDLTPAQEMKAVSVVRDGDFIGVCAPTTFRAQLALDAIAKTAKWESAPHPASKEVYDDLRERVSGGVPKKEFAAELAAAKKTLRATNHTA